MRRLTFARAAIAGALVCLAPAQPATANATALSALKKRLLRVPMSGASGAAISLPVGDGTQRIFDVRDSRTLPRALAGKFPGLRSFRGSDTEGRTLRLDLSGDDLRMSVRHGDWEWTLRSRTATEWSAALAGGTEAVPFTAEPAFQPKPGGWEAALAANAHAPGSTARGGAIRYDFRLAVATSSRYAARFGGTIERTLAEVVHAVNRANEVFETDVGVHFTLVAANDRLIRTEPSRDPFRNEDPGPAAVNLIDREIGPGNYDVGHALTDYTGGESNVGTSCSDARDADFLATHKAAAWSGHAHAEVNPDAIGFMIHVLGRQLGAWPTANGCRRSSLEDRAFEPGGGTTAMSYAASTCGQAPSGQTHADRYFHAANIEQMQDWLGARGGRCASRRINPASAPWIAPETLADRTVIPARTPFVLDAIAEAGTPGRRLTYTWEQIDAGAEQRGALIDPGDGPLFRSFPPSSTGRRVLPHMVPIPGGEVPAKGETLPQTSRTLNFRLTVRDNGGDTSTVTHADKRIDVVDTGRPFAILENASAGRGIAGSPTILRWDVADTTQAPISCHFVDIDLSLDGGQSWLVPALATDEANDGEAYPILPRGIASEHARLRVRCDWRPFFAVSPVDFTIVPAVTY